jgi:hypothetical protein
MVRTRRCSVTPVVVHRWFIVWKDRNGCVREELFETGIIGFLHLLERIDNPTEYAHEYLGHS